MANTITRKVILSGKSTVIYLNIASDGTEETGYVVYDSSVDGISPDSLDSKIMRVWYSTNGVEGATGARINLLWDATTDVQALCLPAPGSGYFDFRPMGGLPNQGGAGITGDVVLTTTGLIATDTLTLIIEVKPD